MGTNGEPEVRGKQRAMTTKRGGGISGANRSRENAIAHLDTRRAERNEHALELVVVRIHEELERQGVSALKLPVAPLVSAAGSLVRLRKAARLAGARYGWTKTRTTKVIDDDDFEWLVMYD
jgi:hypothetical protein